MRYNHITKLNVWKTALFISFFEFFTLLFLPYLNFNSILTGFIDGLVGALLAIFLFNLLSKKITLAFWLDNKKKRLDKINPFLPSLAIGVFLVFLFLSFDITNFDFVKNLIFRNAIDGFINTFIAMIACILTYNILIKISNFRVNVIVNNKRIRIESINMLTTPFFVAIFELFILPFMALFFILFKSLPYSISSPLVGLFGGFIGSFLAAITYNFFAKRFKGIGVSIS